MTPNERLQRQLCFRCVLYGLKHESEREQTHAEANWVTWCVHCGRNHTKAAGDKKKAEVAKQRLPLLHSVDAVHHFTLINVRPGVSSERGNHNKLLGQEVGQCHLAAGATHSSSRVRGAGSRPSRLTCVMRIRRSGADRSHLASEESTARRLHNGPHKHAVNTARS